MKNWFGLAKRRAGIEAGPLPRSERKVKSGSAVLRWEYSPGSALFLVWHQSRSGLEPFGDVQWSRDAGELLREPARNVFVLKATHWIGR